VIKLFTKSYTFHSTVDTMALLNGTRSKHQQWRGGALFCLFDVNLKNV